MDGKTKPQNDVFLTPQQAAKILNISLSTLKKLIYQGKIKTFKTPGGHHRIRKDHLFKVADAEIIKNLDSDIVVSRTLCEITKGYVHVFEKRQKFGQGHAVNVADVADLMARRLNFSTPNRDKLYMAALLHDIGLYGIGECIVNKPNVLDEEEYELIKTHSTIGEEMVNAMDPFRCVSHIVRQHHERYDGLGYPDGLSKDAITMEAKIIAIAETYDSMTSAQSYKNPIPIKEALYSIRHGAGSQFDPELADVFLGLFPQN